MSLGKIGLLITAWSIVQTVHAAVINISLDEVDNSVARLGTLFTPSPGVLILCETTVGIDGRSCVGATSDQVVFNSNFQSATLLSDMESRLDTEPSDSMGLVDVIPPNVNAIARLETDVVANGYRPAAGQPGADSANVNTPVYQISSDVGDIPEPGSFLLFGTGMLSLGACCRKFGMPKKSGFYAITGQK